MRPTISFGFLAFNDWPLLKRTLESALKLKHTQEVEWVIVDNSLDEFRDEMSRNIDNWLQENELDRSIHSTNVENVGEGGGMNQCFELCSAEHILFFQDDWECTVDYPFIDLGIQVLDTFGHIYMVQLSKREWSVTNKNVSFGRVLMPPSDGMTVVEMGDNGFGNNTFQIRLFKRSTWKEVGLYLEDKDIGPEWKGHRKGSVSERDYGVRLQSLGYKAAKINDGQFIHTLEENARMTEESIK